METEMFFGGAGSEFIKLAVFSQGNHYRDHFLICLGYVSHLLFGCY